MKRDYLGEAERVSEERNREVEEEERKLALEEKLRKNKAKIPAEEESDKEQKSGRILSEKDFLVLENIVCRDYRGDAFEKYEKIYVAKDILLNGSTPASFTSYAAVFNCEMRQIFLPSMALTWNILVRLYENRKNKIANDVLMQYKCGKYAQNTLVNYESKEIIHYPRDNDFKKGSKDGINYFDANQGMPRIPLAFSEKAFNGWSETFRLKGSHNHHLRTFLWHLTGVSDLDVLTEIGSYLNLETKAYLPGLMMNAYPVMLGKDTDESLKIKLASMFDESSVRGVKLK